MAYKEVHRVEIEEVIRRWQSGNSQRSIATGTGLSPKVGPTQWARTSFKGSGTIVTGPPATSQKQFGLPSK